MKQLHLLHVALLCIITSLTHAEPKTATLTLSFSENDFNITTDANGLTHIASLQPLSYFSEIETDPAIPYFSTSYVIPSGHHYVSSSTKINKRLIASDVVMARVPHYYTRDELQKLQPTRVSASSIQYAQPQYPSEICKYAGASEWDDLTILYFMHSPFIYDANCRSLYFIDKMDIDITIDFPSMPRTKMRKASFRKAPEYLLNDSIAFHYSISPDSLLHNTGIIQRRTIDYLIITNEALKPAFESLLQWKYAKGLTTSIVTTEYINEQYSGDDLPLKIKRYLKDRMRSVFLKYVMLGGDDTVVPVRFTRNKASGNSAAKYNYPSDIYYACFRGSLDWDRNKNGVYGEISDSIDFTPSIYITRLPVRTTSDVNIFTRKLFNYERLGMWNNNILMCGKRIFRKQHDEIPSDAQQIGENLFQNSIMPYWAGERTTFYDTGSSLPGGANYDFLASNLSGEISKGYGFIDVITHGDQNGWEMEDENSATIYSTEHASLQDNPSSTIIISSACNTNIFDSEYDDYPLDPCLSESFIREFDNGVVAYLGSSRETLFSHTSNGYSNNFIDIIEKPLYFYLFSNELNKKNLGLVTTKAKSSHIPYLLSHPNVNSYKRMFQLVFNPIGDPEMPIYTETPKQFSDLHISFGINSLEVSTGVDSCCVCVTGLSNILYYRKVLKNTNSVSLTGIPKQFSVCVTKQGYIPKMYAIAVQEDGVIRKAEVKSLEQLMKKDMGLSELKQFEHKILCCTPNSMDGTLTISTNINDHYGAASVIITTLTGNREKVIDIPVGETNVTTNISSLPSGVHIASLIVDGKVADSKNIIK